MDDAPRHTLINLVRRNGADVTHDPARIEALLREQCGSYRREITVLVGAAQEGVPADLIKSASTGTHPQSAISLVQRLEENLALEPEAAQWAVYAWAEALGLAVSRQSEADLAMHRHSRWLKAVGMVSACVVVIAAVAFVATSILGPDRTIQAPVAAATSVAAGVVPATARAAVSGSGSATQQTTPATDSRARAPSDWKVVSAGSLASLLPAGAFTTAQDLGSAKWQPDGDKLRVDIKSNFGFAYWIGLDVPTGDKFHLTISARQTGGDGTAFYGLLFHAQGTGPGFTAPFYGIMANDRGYFRGVENGSSNWTRVIPQRPVANTRANQVNYLTVHGEGGQYLLFVNDYFAGEIDNSDLTGGTAGIEFDALDEGSHKNSAIEFGNYEVRTPQ